MIMRLSRAVEGLLLRTQVYHDNLQEYGEFDDQRAVCTLQEAACTTMVALARACAAASRKV